MFLHKNQLNTATEIRREFFFNNDSRNMYPLLNEIVSYIKIHVPSETYGRKISNCKQILIELLTNAVKHSYTSLTTITVRLLNNRIEISKSDIGRRFYLADYTGWPPLSWPLNKEYIGEKIRIYSDDISHLYAIIQNENRITFELTEIPFDELSKESVLLEHYGLLILTKLSNEFFYFYDSSTNSNLFKAVISLY